MGICPNCKTKSDGEICLKCGHELVDNICPRCNNPIRINTVVCPHCGVKVLDGDKNLLLSVILTVIFPGIGHLYIGLTTKAIIFIILAAISYVLMIFFIGFVTYVIVLIWAVLDVIRSTNFMNRGDYVEDKLF